MDAKLSKIYYSPKGYWKGLAAIKQLAAAAKVSEDVAKQWLTKQALWQVYLPGSRYIPRPNFDVSLPNAVHQADLLFLPHDKLPRGKKVYKYALTVVDVASRYKAAEALTSKDSDEVSRGFAKIYRRGPLKWPQMLQVDPGREFMGAVTNAMSEHNVTIRRGRPNIHRDQAIVERFNRTLAERLFGHQYAVEMNMPSGRSTAWVKRLPDVVSALNNEVTRLIGKKPAEAIREKAVASKPATPYMRPVGFNERKLPPQAHVRYLYYPGELEGGGRRATDPIWSLKVYNIQKVVTKPETPVVYYLFDGPKRGFVREELMVVPPGTVLPPARVGLAGVDGGLLLMELDGLRVDAVLQHPALVVVRAQAELALLVRVHGAVVHAEAPVGRHVSTPLEGPLVPLPAQLVLALVDTLGGHLRLPGGLVLHVVALAA